MYHKILGINISKTLWYKFWDVTCYYWALAYIVLCFDDFHYLRFCDLPIYVFHVNIGVIQGLKW